MKKVFVGVSILLMTFCFSTVNAQEVKKPEPKKVEVKAACCSKDANAKTAECTKKTECAKKAECAKSCDAKKGSCSTATTEKKASCCSSDKTKSCSKECSHKEAPKAIKK